VRVLVAADSAVVRAGLEALVAQAPPLVLAGSSSPDSLAARIRELQPDVVLMDWPRGDEEALEPLLKAGPAVVLLADEPDPATLAAGLRTGLRALLPHHASAEEIVAAIGAVAGGLIVLHPDIIGSLQFLEQPRRSPAEVDTALTPREIEVLRMLAEGLANKNIAWRMGISEHTVKFHIASIFTKLNASSRAEAVAIGMRQGLILL
jgi:DNA-binding NarL/FixJ family response regulator